jgi:hypothetical protein
MSYSLFVKIVRAEGPEYVAQQAEGFSCVSLLVTSFMIALLASGGRRDSFRMQRSSCFVSSAS